LPDVDEEVKKKYSEWSSSLKKKGTVFTPLKGDASHKYEYTVGEETKELSEDERVAFMVQEIDEECSVVPVGSFVLNSSQRVIVNPYYKGLDLSAAVRLDSYMHLRKPRTTPALPVAERSALKKSTQFLDFIANDQPKGCWSLKHDPSSSLVVLRSLSFPGFVHFNAVDSPVHGAIYNGTGARNFDLPFML